MAFQDKLITTVEFLADQRELKQALRTVQEIVQPRVVEFSLVAKGQQELDRLALAVERISNQNIRINVETQELANARRLFDGLNSAAEKFANNVGQLQRINSIQNLAEGFHKVGEEISRNLQQLDALEGRLADRPAFNQTPQYRQLAQDLRNPQNQTAAGHQQALANLVSARQQYDQQTEELFRQMAERDEVIQLRRQQQEQIARQGFAQARNTEALLDPNFVNSARPAYSQFKDVTPAEYARIQAEKNAGFVPLNTASAGPNFHPPLINNPNNFGVGTFTEEISDFQREGQRLKQQQQQQFQAYKEVFDERRQLQELLRKRLSTDLEELNQLRAELHERKQQLQEQQFHAAQNFDKDAYVQATNDIDATERRLEQVSKQEELVNRDNRRRGNTPERLRQLNKDLLRLHSEDLTPENFPDVLAKLGEKHGLSPELLHVASIKPPKFFDPRRLLDNETLVQLGFAAAFGGVPSLIGGAIGGSTPLGSSGALLGSTLTQAGFEILLKQPIEKIKEAIEQFKEAGLAFSRSILGITSILQETNNVVSSASGKALNTPGQIQAALNFQATQAREIQLAARSKLLPLGIGGQTEATFVQGVVSALSQRGLNANAGQTARISELIAGAITAQRPQLLENTQQLLKDLQDILGGGPNASRTVLGQILRPVLPQLQNANSIEDVQKALERLSPFITAATSLQNPVVAQQKLSGAIENIKTNAGDAYLQQITPALLRMFDVLSKPEIVAAVEKFAEGIGHITAQLIDLGSAVIDTFGKFLPDLRELPNALKQGSIAIGEFAAVALALSQTRAPAAFTGLAEGGLVNIADYLEARNARQGGPSKLTKLANAPVFGQTAGKELLAKVEAQEARQLVSTSAAGAAAGVASGAAEKAGVTAALARVGTALAAGITALFSEPLIIAGTAAVIAGLFLGLKSKFDEQRGQEIQEEQNRVYADQITRIRNAHLNSEQKLQNQAEAILNRGGLKDILTEQGTSERTSPEAQIGVLDDFANAVLEGTQSSSNQTREDARKLFLESSPVVARKYAELQRGITESELNTQFNAATPVGAELYARAQLEQEFPDQIESLQTAKRADEERLAESQGPKSKAIATERESRRLLEDQRNREQKSAQAALDAAKKERKEANANFGDVVAALFDPNKVDEVKTRQAKADEKVKAAQDALNKANKGLEDASKAAADNVGIQKQVQDGIKSQIRKDAEAISNAQKEAFGTLLKLFDSIKSQTQLELEGVDQRSTAGKERANKISIAGLQKVSDEIGKALTRPDLKPEEKALLLKQFFANDQQLRLQEEQRDVFLPAQRIRDRADRIDRTQFGSGVRVNEIESAANADEIRRIQNKIASLKAAGSGADKGQIDALEGILERDYFQKRPQLAQQGLESRTSSILEGLSAVNVPETLQKSAMDLAAHFNDLTKAVTDTANALSDFEQDTELRRLGRQGQRLSAADKYLKSGGSEANVDADTLLLLKNPSARADFEQRSALEELKSVERRTDSFRSEEEDQNTLTGLKDRAAAAQFASAQQPAEEQKADIQNALSAIERYAKYKNGSPKQAALFKNDAETGLQTLQQNTDFVSQLTGATVGFGEGFGGIDKYLETGLTLKQRNGGAVNVPETPESGPEATAKQAANSGGTPGAIGGKSAGQQGTAPALDSDVLKQIADYLKTIAANTSAQTITQDMTTAMEQAFR